MKEYRHFTILIELTDPGVEHQWQLKTTKKQKPPDEKIYVSTAYNTAKRLKLCLIQPLDPAANVQKIQRGQRNM